MIGADLATADIGALLADNGFDKSKKTFFSCLGLLYYFSDGEVRALFSKISAFAAKLRQSQCTLSAKLMHGYGRVSARPVHAFGKVNARFRQS